MAAVIETSLNARPVTPKGFAGTGQGGADVVFLGRTRGETHPVHGLLRHLEYEAQAALAASTLAELAEEAAKRWPLLAIRVQHAIGIIEVGQASVCIEVVSPHRGEAFESCRWLIDSLKVRVPIWKREVWQDGTTWADGAPVETLR
jgi:molybdopterin synthase catalytic subunit